MEVRVVLRRVEIKEENEEVVLFGVFWVGVVVGGLRLFVIGGEGVVFFEGVGVWDGGDDDDVVLLFLLVMIMIMSFLFLL